MKIAALQMVSVADWPSNRGQADALLAQAAAQGAELAVLPEYFCLMGHRDEDKLALQEPFGSGPIQSFLSEAARKHAVWLVAGTIPLRADLPGRVFNSSLAFDPTGRCVARYDKMHLFRFDNGAERYDEARVLQPGAQPTCFALESKDRHGWQVGLSVCYDLRFPELYRAYASMGTDLLLVPSAFTFTTGKAHWEVLLRARAIENLSFVAAAAQGGVHANGRRTWGHTMVVDPWGSKLGLLAEGAGVVCVELDAAQLQQIRGQLPALQHRVLV